MIRIMSILTFLLFPFSFAVADQNSESVGILMKEVSEIGTILDDKGVIIDPANLCSNVSSAMIKAVDRSGGILNKEQARRKKEEAEGIYYGPGLKLEIKDQRPYVLKVMEGGPSEKAGLERGVFIEKIGEKETRNMSLEKVTGLLRGGKGEKVVITVSPKEKDNKTRQFEIVRDVIQMPVTGTQEEWPQGIGYLKVNGLYKKSGSEIVSQLREWAEKDFDGVILDVRGAGGMDFDAVSDIAVLFDNDGKTLFLIRDGHKKVTASYPVNNDEPLGVPVMVLVDRDTSGAAEVLAAVLRNSRGAMLIGTPTKGDNRIREQIPLSDGRILYIATRQIELGQGKTYYGKGVRPHVLVSQIDTVTKDEPLDNKKDTKLFLNLSEQEKQDRALIERVRSDTVLCRAADILLGLKALDIKLH